MQLGQGIQCRVDKIKQDKMHKLQTENQIEMNHYINESGTNSFPTLLQHGAEHSLAWKKMHS